MMGMWFGEGSGAGEKRCQLDEVNAGWKGETAGRYADRTRKKWISGTIGEDEEVICARSGKGGRGK